MHLNLEHFYSRREWTELRRNIIEDRAVNGVVYCEHCGKPILDLSKVHAHHIQELTEDNVQDVNISLNPDNIMLVHHECHNEIHERWNGSKKRLVYLVYGAPCSGKSTYVKKHAGRNDIVLDIDNIWEMLTVNDRYVKPDCLKPCVFRIRDEVLDVIRTRTGKWENAYIVGGYPYRRDREFFQKKFSAIPIHIDTPEEICLERARNKEWEEYISRWFADFEA